MVTFNNSSNCLVDFNVTSLWISPLPYLVINSKISGISITTFNFCFGVLSPCLHIPITHLNLLVINEEADKSELRGLYGDLRIDGKNLLLLRCDDDDEL